MKVAELIGQLQLVDAELDVVVCSGDRDWQIASVKSTTHEGNSVVKVSLQPDTVPNQGFTAPQASQATDLQ